MRVDFGRTQAFPGHGQIKPELREIERLRREAQNAGRAVNLAVGEFEVRMGDVMGKFGWNVGGSIEATSFKRRPDVWLFEVPRMWPRRTYLVTDEQKAMLVKPLIRMQWALYLIALVGFILCVKILQDQDSLTLLIVLVGGVLVVGLIFSFIYTEVVIRPLLAGLPITSDRIRFSDKFKAQIALLPRALIICAVLFSFIMFAGGFVAGLLDGWDSFEIAMAVVFGSMTLVYIGVFVIRQRAI